LSAAVLILCGGFSRRMGQDKAALRFGEESMLARVARIASNATDEIWLLAREGQELPNDVPANLPVARDPAEGRGPLAGIVSGLSAMNAEIAYVTSCDVPLLQPPFIEKMLDLAKNERAVVPRQDGHLMPTTAVYRGDIVSEAEALLARDELRPRMLLSAIAGKIVEADSLRDVDPELLSLMDCDTPEDYERLLDLASARSTNDPI
jgi:molybdopterin-guanine dinucleotide biosynthesis protein A